MDLHVIAQPTEVIPCCCNEEVGIYRDFNVTWNVTTKGVTLVTNCKGSGLIGSLEHMNLFASNL